MKDERDKPVATGGEEFASSRTAKIMGMFMTVLLMAAAGCGSSQTDSLEHVHYDKNGDGYCDEDGQPMRANASGYGSGGGYYYLPHVGGAAAGTASAVKGPAGGISSGSHGGIGSAAAGGGG